MTIGSADERDITRPIARPSTLRDKERAFRYPGVGELEWPETGGPGILW